jgi:hypothetical protein
VFSAANLSVAKFLYMWNEQTQNNQCKHAINSLHPSSFCPVLRHNWSCGPPWKQEVPKECASSRQHSGHELRNSTARILCDDLAIFIKEVNSSHSE